MTSNPNDDHLEQVIAAACRLLGSGTGAGNVTVVAGRRLTYRELAAVRQEASADGVDLTMDGTGLVTLRRSTEAQASPPVTAPRGRTTSRGHRSEGEGAPLCERGGLPSPWPAAHGLGKGSSDGF